MRLILLVALLAGIFLVGRGSGATAYLGPQRLRATVLAAGDLGVPLFFLAFAAGTLLQLPGLLFVAVGVLVYGRLKGGILSYLAALLALILSFWLTRAIGGKALSEVEQPRLKALLARLDRRPISTVIFLRVLFVLSPQLNTVLSLSALRFRDYLIGSALGLLPLIAVAVLLFDQVLRHLGPGR